MLKTLLFQFNLKFLLLLPALTNYHLEMSKVCLSVCHCLSLSVKYSVIINISTRGRSCP